MFFSEPMIAPYIFILDINDVITELSIALAISCENPNGITCIVIIINWTTSTPLIKPSAKPKILSVVPIISFSCSFIANFIIKCYNIFRVPRVFLPLVLKGCVSWARENNVTLITAEHMQIINDKRSKEKKK